METGPGLVCIGDNVVDLYRDRGVFYPGGNALNVAVLARRAGLARSAYIGIVGSDREGAHVRASMLAEGISDALVREAVGPNGKAQVTHDASGDRVFVGTNHGGIRRRVMLRMDEDDLALVAALGHVHSSCFSYLEPELPRLRAVARELSFDFSTGRDPAYLAAVCPHVSTAFLSGADLDEAGLSALIRQVQGHGTTTVCITLGERGAVWARGGTVLRQGIVPTAVVDTMGAGDGFIAGYLAASIAGAEPPVALQRAAAHAAATCGWHGAWGHGMADA